MKIPKAFCITLSDTPDREKSAREQLKSVGIDAKFIYGINGYKLGLKSSSPDIYNTPTKEEYTTMGSIGNFLSHIIVWKICEQLEDDEFLIFEDDIVFTHDFNKKFEKLYLNLPTNWDMVYVGGIKWGDNNFLNKIGDGIVQTKVGGTHAYLIKKHVIRILLKSFEPIQSAIDLTLINRVWDKINCYVFDPTLVFQKSYANANDPTWYSLIYDWNDDLYKFKNSIYSKIEFTSGWYNVEKNNSSIWRWTDSKFTIRLPEKSTELILSGHIPMDNVLSFGYHDQLNSSIELKQGGFSINLPLSPNGGLLKCQLKNRFIPSECELNTSDNRTLGVCINNMSLNFGQIKIPVNMEVL